MVFISRTEVLRPSGSRPTSQAVNEAKKQELKILLWCSCFRIAIKEGTTADRNVPVGRFLSAIKAFLDFEIKCRDKYVIDGHLDKFVNIMVYFSSSLQLQLVCLHLALDFLFFSPVDHLNLPSVHLDSWSNWLRHLHYQTWSGILAGLQAMSQMFVTCIMLICFRRFTGMRRLTVTTVKSFPRNHQDLVAHCSTPIQIEPFLDWVVPVLTNWCKQELSVFALITTAIKRSLKWQKNVPCPRNLETFVIYKDTESTICIDNVFYLGKLEMMVIYAAFSHFWSMHMRHAWLFHSSSERFSERARLA